MPSNLQDLFSELRTTQSPDMWYGQPNVWARLLSPRKLGEVAETLLVKALGGSRTHAKTGYNVVVGEKLIATKSATVGLSNRSPFVAWHNIRLDDPFTHLGLVAIYPSDVRIFLVGREHIRMSDLTLKRGTTSTYELATRQVNLLLPWLTAWEIK